MLKTGRFLVGLDKIRLSQRGVLYIDIYIHHGDGVEEAS